MEWLTEQLESTPQYVREQQELEVAGLQADTEQCANGAWEELRVRMGKAQECARRAQQAVDRVETGGRASLESQTREK